MTSAIPPTADVARRWIEDDFGVPVLDVEVVDGGADPAAAVWRVTAVGGALYAAKWTSRRTRTGTRLVDAVDAAGVQGAPVPLPTLDGRTRSTRAGGKLSVAGWIDGDDALETGLDLDQWQAYGALLAAVHAHPFPAGEQERRTGARRGIRRRRRRYRAGIAALDARVGTSTGGSSIDPVLQDWQDARGHVDLLVRGTRLPIGPPTSSVPCHGDPHLGNVMAGTDGHLRLIDWDEAVVAPRELDLHLVEFSVLFQPIADDQLAAFRRGYGAVGLELDESRMVRFACVRALEDLVSTALGALDGPAADRDEHLRVFHGILSPVGSASLVLPRLHDALSRTS